MSGDFRTAAGGRIDRAKPLAFTFDGRALQGFAGDTLASALLANGIHLVGRSYKYHRPRGILSAGPEEPNALVRVDRGGGRETPNLRATQVELYDGLAAWSQNRWPSLTFDMGAISSLFSPFLSAGFYYKTFMGPDLRGPNWAWTRVYEPLIRRAAGLGAAPSQPDPDSYANRFAHCDVLIAGAGPAGLAAALAAAAAGARVILCDEQAELGGSLLSETSARIDGIAAGEWAQKAVAALKQQERVTLLPRTQAFGYLAQNFIALAERLTDHLARPAPPAPRERLWQVRAKHVVLATGAIERPLVFAGNDRPGIMLAGAARVYLNRYGVRPGTRAVVFTACDTAYEAALDLKRAGLEIALIADVRPRHESPAAEAARASGIAVESGTVINHTRGRLRVSSVTAGRLKPDGTVGAAGRISCDLVLMSGGWTPSVHLFSQSRGKLAWSEGINAFVPAQSVQAERSAGACRGVFSLAAAIEDGFAAGHGAAAAATGTQGRRIRSDVSATSLDHRGEIGACPSAAPNVPAFVDFQHDVTVKDLELAAQEGFQSIEHVKRYTTAGMAPDQGKTSNLNTAAIVARALGKSVPAAGLTTFRPPYTPVTFGTLAGMSRGEVYDPARRTPIHGWAQDNGAVFEDAGRWKRARYFARDGETMHQAVAQECRTVRSIAGLFDASTLGKIEVTGPDAAAFLDRMYINALGRLELGRCRYSILCGEDGFIIDDGIAARLAPDVFHVTTASGGAERVLNMMEDYRQTEFTDLKVWLTSTTEQWAVIAVQGPRARDILAPLVEEADLSAARFPHMRVRECRVAGVSARLFRVSFTGELGFEVNVPSGFGEGVWDAIWKEAQKYGGCAYGTEAMHVLRAEKGYIIIGQETDGTVTPDDAGLACLIGKQKKDFIGKRSLVRPDMIKAGRKQLVGLKTRDQGTVLEEGAQIVAAPRVRAGTPALGHITSSYESTLGHSIALAMIADGRRRMGEKLFVPMPGGDIEAEVVPHVFYDPAGGRLNG
jgi:sarcosine oxidase, subunit alpha